MSPVRRIELPIFELPLVLVPHEQLPLHIFEERYKAMINHCLAAEKPFGVLLRVDDGVAEVGCTANVTRVLERFDDGRLNILVTGELPFRVLGRIEGGEFPAGDVELLTDEAGTPDPGAGEAARSAFSALVERATGEPPEAEELAGLDAYAMVARIELESEAKQDLLELRSEEGRLRKVETLFRTVAEAIGRAEEIRQRSAGNGKVR